MLKIADHIFEIESYKFGPCVCIGQHGWHVSWTLEFYTASRDINGIDWKPQITPHCFSSLVSNLEDLNNLKIKLSDRDTQDNEPMFLLYVFEHEAVRDVELSFGEWKNNEIDFTFSGISNVYASEEHNRNLPINIALKLKCKGVSVNEGELDWAIKKFSKFFDLTKFQAPESLGKGCGFIFRPLNENS